LGVEGVGAEGLAYDQAGGAGAVGLGHEVGDGFGDVMWVRGIRGRELRHQRLDHLAWNGADFAVGLTTRGVAGLLGAREDVGRVARPAST
jgi:hypothetical protein